MVHPSPNRLRGTGRDGVFRDSVERTETNERVLRRPTGPDFDGGRLMIPSGAGKDDIGRLRRWELNYAANAGRVKKSADAVTSEEIVWVFGDGPGLRKNRSEIGRIGTGAVVGVEDAGLVIPSERLKYLFCGEEFEAGEAWERRYLGRTTGVLNVGTDVRVNVLGFGRRVWYAGGEAREARVMRLDEAPDARCAGLCWVARALRPRVIVLAGMDFAFSGGWRRYDEPLQYEAEADYLVARDIEGNAVLTDQANLSAAEWVLGACRVLRVAGVRVINASEGGLLGEDVELKTLGDVVDELNGGR